MNWKSLIGTSTLALGTLGLTACYGKVDPHDGPRVVGSYAELVVKKKEWLKNYDADCQVCFQAFEQCQLGAAGDSERSACQTALEACVRGGLVNQDDPSAGDGDSDSDATDESVDDDGANDGVSGNDGASGGDAGAGAGAGVDDGADAGVDDTSDADGGSVADDGESTTDDANDDSDAADDANDDSDSDDSDGEVDDATNDGGDEVKQELIENIEACLADTRSCVSAANADFRACVVELNGCVKSAIQEAFGEVCEGQIGMCIAQKAPEAALESVEDLCQLGLVD